MGERSPIFGRDSTQIGYVEGAEAFDLSGRKRCNYSKETGNLFDDNRKTVGHVSLAGKFVGVFSIADKLFPKFDIAEIELRGIGRTPGQPEFEVSEVAASADLAAGPRPPDSTEAIQFKDEDKQPTTGAEHRDISAPRDHPISGARQVVALAEAAPSPHDSTEAIQPKDENEQRAADAERRDSGGTPSQQLSEARQETAIIESAEQPIAHYPIETIQIKDEMAIIESVEQPTAHDPIEAIQIKNEYEQHAADRDSGGTRSQPLSEARQVAAPAELTEAQTTPGSTEGVQAKNEHEQRAADAERRGISRTRNQQLFETRRVTPLIESAEQLTAHDPTEAIQINGENEQHAADRDSGGTRSQPLSEARQVAAPAELAEAPTTPGPTEAVQAKDEHEQPAADAERRDISRTPSQQLSEARQVTALIESAEQPTAHDPIEAIQIDGGNEQHAADRNSGGTRSQPLSEASRVAAPAELAEAPTTPGPTEAVQAKNEHEQRAADAERRGISRTRNQQLFETRRVTPLIESAEQLTAHDPTEAIQINGENEQHAADRDSGGSRSQPWSEARRVAAPAELAEAPTTPGPSEAFYVQHENGRRAADAESRVIGGTLSQVISELSEATTLIGPPEEPSTAELTEALHSNDAEKVRVAEILKSLERLTEVKRRGIGGSSDLSLSRPSNVSTLGSPQESSAPNSIETFKRKDTAKDRLVKFVKALKRGANAKRGGSSETLDQAPYSPTKVATRTISSQEPSTPEPSEALHSKDADKDRLVEILKALERSADTNRRGVEGTPSQSSSTPTKVRTPTGSPAKPSAPDLAEGFPSNDADKDQVVNALKALMKRSRGLIADAPRLQQAEENDLALTLSVMSDPVTPDETRVPELESHDRELKRLLDSSGQDQGVGTEFSAPIDNHFYQGSSATGRQTRPHNAIGTNQQPAPAAPTDPAAEYPSRASVDTSAAPAAQPLHDASPRLALADDNALENARAGKYHRGERGMPPAVEAFMRRLAEDESSSSYQTTDGGDELAAGSEDLNNTDQVSLAGELDVAAEEQVAAEVPTAAKAPTAAEALIATEAPITAEEPTAAEEPATAEVSITAEALTESEAPPEAEASTRAEASPTAEEPTGTEERAAQEWTAAEQQTTADDDLFDSISAKPSSIPMVASKAWARSTPRSDDHMRWESVLRDRGLDDAGNAGREDLAQGELASQAISGIHEKPGVAERNQSTEPNTFDRHADQNDAQSQEHGDGPPSAPSETAAFADSPSERNDPDLAKGFFEVDVERAMAMARSKLGLRDAGLGGGDSDPTEGFFAVDIERAVLTVRDELGEVTARADSRGADGAADTRDPRAEIVSTNTDRTLRTMLRELKKKPE